MSVIKIARLVVLVAGDVHKVIIAGDVHKVIIAGDVHKVMIAGDVHKVIIAGDVHKVISNSSRGQSRPEGWPGRHSLFTFSTCHVLYDNMNGRITCQSFARYVASCQFNSL
jgi:hypothetical protein